MRCASARSHVRETSTPAPTTGRRVEAADHTTQRGSSLVVVSTNRRTTSPSGHASSTSRPTAYAAPGPTTSATSGGPEALSVKAARDPLDGLAEDVGGGGVVEPRVPRAAGAEDRTGGERDACAAQHLARGVVAEAQPGEVEPREVGRLGHDESGSGQLRCDELGEQTPVGVELADEAVHPL